MVLIGDPLYRLFKSDNVHTCYYSRSHKYLSINARVFSRYAELDPASSNYLWLD